MLVVSDRQLSFRFRVFNMSSFNYYRNTAESDETSFTHPYSVQIHDFIQEYQSLKHDAELLFEENQQLKKNIAEYAELYKKSEQENELQQQENRVLKNLLKLGWEEEDRLKSIQEQKESVVKCLEELGTTQCELEEALKSSRSHTLKLTTIAIGLGKITTTCTKRD